MTGMEFAETLGNCPRRLLLILNDLSDHLEKSNPNLEQMKKCVDEAKSVAREPEDGENPMSATVASIDQDVDQLIELQKGNQQPEVNFASQQKEIKQLQKDAREKNSLIEKLRCEIELLRRQLNDFETRNAIDNRMKARLVLRQILRKTQSMIYNRIKYANIETRDYTIKELLKTKKINYEPVVRQMLVTLNLEDIPSICLKDDLTDVIKGLIEDYDMNIIAHAKEETEQLKDMNEIDAIIQDAVISEEDTDIFKRIAAAYLEVLKLPAMPPPTPPPAPTTTTTTTTTTTAAAATSPPPA